MSDRPFDLRRVNFIVERARTSKSHPAYDFYFDKSVADALEIKGWRDGHLNRESITDWLAAYENEDGTFRKKMNRLLQGEAGGRSSAVSYSHPEKKIVAHNRATLWEAAVIMAGVHHAANSFSRLLVLRAPKDVQEITEKFGRRFFTTQTMVRAVYHCAISSLSVDGENINDALCGRTLVVGMLPLANIDTESLVHNGKKGLWSREYQDIYKYINDYYKRCPTADDKFRYQLEAAQDLAAMSAILEGALVVSIPVV